MKYRQGGSSSSNGGIISGDGRGGSGSGGYRVRGGGQNGGVSIQVVTRVVEN